MINLDNCTYGLEIEGGGLNRSKVLPEGNTWCDQEGTIFNERGIGNDPRGEFNYLGGEIQVKPCDSEEELYDTTMELYELTATKDFDFASTIHVHIYVPDFLEEENLETFKRFISWNQYHYPALAPLIAPLPKMTHFTPENYNNPDHLKKMKSNYKSKYRGRHSVMSKTAHKRFESSNHDNIHDLIVGCLPTYNPNTNKPMWNIFLRNGINFSKMRPDNTNTIEFRMFTGFSVTKHPEQLKTIIEFPKRYIQCFLEDKDPLEYFKEDIQNGMFPDKNDGYYLLSEQECLNHIHTNIKKNKRKDSIEYIENKLIEKEILLSDLGYPEKFWKKKLGEEKYAELYEHSLSCN